MDGEIRQRLLALVQARLKQFDTDRNPATVLGPGATAELTALLATVQNPLADLEIAAATGGLHWRRYRALDAGAGQQELERALSYFAPVYQVRPDELPGEAREYFNRLAAVRRLTAAHDPQAIAQRAADLLGATVSTGNQVDLDAVILVSQQLAAAVPVRDPVHAESLSTLGFALTVRFSRTGDRGDLDAGIDAARLAVAFSPGDADYLSNLSTGLTVRFGETGNRDDLDAAIDASQWAVAAVSASYPNRPAMLSQLGHALTVRFQRTGNPADLDAGIAAGQRAVGSIPANHPHRAGYLTMLGDGLQTRFERTGSGADLDAAIDASQQAVAATPVGHADRPAMLTTSANALLARFERAGELADLDAAIDANRQAVNTGSAPKQPSYLTNLGLTLRTRFERTGNGADLDAAIDASQRAAAATPVGHPARAATQSALGLALQARFEWTGELADLDAAIDAAQEAEDASPPEYPGRAGYWSNLGVARQLRFGRTGDLADLDAAIDAGRQAVAASPEGHAKRAGLLGNLGNTLNRRFRRTGDLADLDAAIHIGRQAVAASPADHPFRASYLTTIVGAAQSRFERTGDGADLDVAINAAQRAAAALPAGHPNRAKMLSNLGRVLQIRSERTENLADADAAVKASLEAVAAAPGDHPDRVRCLAILCLTRLTRFERTGNGADLDAAIDAGRQAVATSPDDLPDRAWYLSNLSVALRTRFQRTRTQADLNAAIDTGRDAAAATPVDHPERVVPLVNLGAALTTRFEQAGDEADLDAAIDAGRQAVGLTAASPRVRAMAARGWGNAAASGRRWADAVAGYSAAAELLSLVAPRSLARGDQERLLEQFGGLGADAAACCVHSGQPDRAVELFEQSRGVLLGQALDLRTDLTVLAEQDIDLATRFTILRDILDGAGPLAGPAPVMPADADETATNGRSQTDQDDVDRRRTAVTQLEQVIAEIRQLPGFNSFLRPLPAAELLAAATEGAVVVATVSRFGSYALILTSDGVLDPVPLIGFTPEEVRNRVTAFLRALGDVESPAAEQQLDDILGWLWDTLAGPVHDQLGITGRPAVGKPLPRLWWCLSGLLSFLPVHAAGHHQTQNDTEPATVIDRVISSYTPTIRALTYARRSTSASPSNGGDPAGAGNRVIAVAMPHTDDDVPDLPSAEGEVAALEQRFPGRVTVLSGPQATRATVLDALPSGRWAHFACHGASDLANPSASHLLLTDYRQRPLTVTDMARLRLDDADLAFLSACSSGRPGDRLADEAIHLASAFQLAGYRQVIATLWPIGDEHARAVAGRIYGNLGAASGTDAARAVQDAVQMMRRRWGDAPSVWASHIHVGA